MKDKEQTVAEDKNLFISAAIHPTIHSDLEKIGKTLGATIKSGGSKTLRVRLALFMAARMKEEDLAQNILAMTARELKHPGWKESEG